MHHKLKFLGCLFRCESLKVEDGIQRMIAPVQILRRRKKQLYYISIIDNNKVENKKEVLLDMGLMI